MQHLDEGTIHAWLDGALAGDEAAGVARHVAECRDCAAMVAEARGMIAASANIISALDSVRGGVIPAPTPAVAGRGSLWRRLRFTPTRAAQAATLLVAYASLLTIRRVPRPGAGEPEVTRVTPAPAAVSESKAAPALDSLRIVAKDAASTRPSRTGIATPSTGGASPTSKRVVDAVAPKPAQTGVSASRVASDSVTNSAANRAIPSAAAAPPVESADLAKVARAPAPKATPDANAGASGRQFAPALQLREVTATGARSRAEIGELEGCYQIRADSASSVFAAGVPSRFALVNTAGTAMYAVRSVSPAGRVDSIVPGGSWQRLTPDVVRVRFADARQQPLTLQLTAGAVTGQATVGGQVVNLPVTRMDCPR
jgi:hypothetical protein